MGNSLALGLRKPIYQVLASYYAYTDLNVYGGWWVGAAGAYMVVVETYFSVQLKLNPS